MDLPLVATALSFVALSAIASRVPLARRFSDEPEGPQPSPTSPLDEKPLRMRYSSFARGFGRTLIALSMIPFGIGLLLSEDGQSICLWAGSALGIYQLSFFLELRTQVRVVGDTITTRSFWRGERLIRWQDIESVSFSWFLTAFVLRPRAGDTVIVAALMTDIAEFVRRLERRARAPGVESAVESHLRLQQLLRDSERD